VPGALAVGALWIAYLARKALGKRPPPPPPAPQPPPPPPDIDYYI
jgi:hypothetical protein